MASRDDQDSQVQGSQHVTPCRDQPPAKFLFSFATTCCESARVPISLATSSFNLSVLIRRKSLLVMNRWSVSRDPRWGRARRFWQAYLTSVMGKYGETMQSKAHKRWRNTVDMSHSIICYRTKRGGCRQLDIAMMVALIANCTPILSLWLLMFCATERFDHGAVKLLNMWRGGRQNAYAWRKSGIPTVV